MAGQNEFRFCKKCLTRDMIDKDTYFSTLQEMIAAVSGEVRASDALYEERLNKCKACGRLADGMCRACGCYVELRAVIDKNSCPYNEW